jgi:hypothetical protein
MEKLVSEPVRAFQVEIAAINAAELKTTNRGRGWYSAAQDRSGRELRLHEIMDELQALTGWKKQ